MSIIESELKRALRLKNMFSTKEIEALKEISNICYKLEEYNNSDCDSFDEVIQKLFIDVLGFPRHAIEHFNATRYVKQRDFMISYGIIQITVFYSDFYGEELELIKGKDRRSYYFKKNIDHKQLRFNGKSLAILDKKEIYEIDLTNMDYNDLVDLYRLHINSPTWKDSLSNTLSIIDEEKIKIKQVLKNKDIGELDSRFLDLDKLSFYVNRAYSEYDKTVHKIITRIEKEYNEKKEKRLKNELEANKLAFKTSLKQMYVHIVKELYYKYCAYVPIRADKIFNTYYTPTYRSFLKEYMGGGQAEIQGLDVMCGITIDVDFEI